MILITGARGVVSREAVRLLAAGGASPRAVQAAAADLLARARQTGTRRVVVLSAVTVQYPAGHTRFRQQFQAVENIAKGCGLDWTILRCADFAANTLAGYAPRTVPVACICLAQAARTSTVDCWARWPTTPAKRGPLPTPYGGCWAARRARTPPGR